MEKLILGSEVADSEAGSGKNAFSECYVIVRKGHGDCGDSAFVYSDESKTILAVFDGVSGEAGAANASSEAAEALLDGLKGLEKIDAKKMEAAVRKAHERITFGLTTMAVAFVRKDGSFMVAGIGDSPIYSFSRKGQVDLELPLARAVKDGDAVFKYFYYRNMLTSALGPGSSWELAIRSGKLKSGEMLILASDGLSDNLYVKVKDGFVAESSGLEDLRGLIGKRESPEGIVKALAEEVQRRLAAGKIERADSILVPKEDDLAIAVIRML